MSLSGFENIIQALGWTLLHSVWIIGMLALFFYLLISFLPQERPEVRYGLGVLSLLLTLLLSAVTFWNIYDQSQETLAPQLKQIKEDVYVLEPVQKEVVSTEENSTVWDLQYLFEEVRLWVGQRINWLVGTWIFGILLLSFRFCGSLYYLEKLKKRSEEVAVPHLQSKMKEMADLLMISSPVKLMASGVAHTPMLIGHLKPVILMPAAMLSGLSEDQLEAIIAHELAHIYRKDYWVNLLQSVLEIIFFFHPGVWWISSVVRAEREKCCDDLAVSLCGNSIEYAKALTRIEEIKSSQPKLALAFGGNKGGLLSRIERILQPEKKHINLRARFVSGSLVMLCLFILLSATESQAIRYGSEKAQDAFRWVKTSYLPIKLENYVPSPERFVRPEKSNVKTKSIHESQSGIANDTLPQPSAAPQAYSFHINTSNDSINPSLDISLPIFTKLDTLATSAFVFQDSVFKTIDFRPDSMLVLLLNNLPDSNLILNLSNITAPQAPMAIDLSTDDSLLSNTIHQAMTIADSALSRVLNARAFAAPQMLNDTTLEARLRKLEQEMIAREREMEALMRQREREIEMLMREKEAELRLKEQAIVRELKLKERELQQKLREQQVAMEQEMRQHDLALKREEKKMEKEMADSERKLLKLEAQMIEDQIIESGQRYTIVVTTKCITVNGKSFCGDTFRKYREFMKDEGIFDFNKGNRMSITRDAK